MAQEADAFSPTSFAIGEKGTLLLVKRTPEKFDSSQFFVG